MRCPVCGDEYEAGVTACVDCRVPLTADGLPGAHGRARPRADARLGRFHSAAGERVELLLERRGVAYEAVPDGSDVEILVESAARDELRAELALTWEELLGDLDPDARAQVRTGDERLAGWRDAPVGAWVDRDGRLQVAPHPEEEAEADARRVAGPALLTLGVFLVLLAWYADGGGLVTVIGLALIVLGALLPR